MTGVVQDADFPSDPLGEVFSHLVPELDLISEGQVSATLHHLRGKAECMRELQFHYPGH